MNFISLLIELFLLLDELFLHADCKILRIRNHYVARFVLVDSDLRLKSHFIRNITKFTTPQECSSECIKEKKCVSINRHRELGFCELLAVSKFNDTTFLQRDLNWVHYETDDDEKNIGNLCRSLSPCQPYEVCEMTFECDPAFICRCRDGFTGLKCEEYIGPGTERSNPAASCHLLMSKHRSIPDGEYWFKGQNEKRRCDRRVDGGYTKWSPFSPCDKPNCGGEEKQNRSRTCTNPSPKGGGRSCHMLGPIEEFKYCEVCCHSLFIDEPFKTSRGHLFTTFGRMLKEYKVEFELKVEDAMKLLGTDQSILHFTVGKNNQQVGDRQPALWLKRHFSTIHMTFSAGINNLNHGHYPRRESSQFKKWMHIVISQKKIDEKYWYQIYIDGTSVYAYHNSIPREYADMKLYLSDPWFPNGLAFIKNMHLEGYCERKDTIKPIKPGIKVGSPDLT